jgi:hypothetical protein
MPLHAPEPTAGESEVVRQAVYAFAENRRFSTEGLRSARPDALTVTDPHQVFNLGLDDLRSGADLTAAKPTGWRYLVRDGDRVVAAAESVSDPAGGGPVFSQFNEGPFVPATAGALAVAGSDRRVVDRRFTPRLLHIPALHAMALWLHPDDAGDNAGKARDNDDLLIPLAPFPLDVQTGVATPATPLLRLLAELAATIPDDPYGRQGG